MTKRLPILLLVAVADFARSQDLSQQRENRAESRCELMQDAYAVFAAFLSGLHGPEDPEEKWEGKEMLIVDVTATPSKPEGRPSHWGFRSKSSAALPKRHSVITSTKRIVRAQLSPNSVTSNPMKHCLQAFIMVLNGD
jgi:hypothetical protein